MSFNLAEFLTEGSHGECLRKVVVLEMLDVPVQDSTDLLFGCLFAKQHHFLFPLFNSDGRLFPFGNGKCICQFLDHAALPGWFGWIMGCLVKGFSGH
jgi:hypothetical protein